MCVVLCYCEGGLKFFFCFLPPRDLSTPHDSHVSKDLITGEIAVAIHLLEKPAKYVIPALYWQPRVDSRLRLLPRAVASSRPVGSCKILGVLMTFMVCYSYILEILAMLNANFFLISRNIWGAIAPQAPPLSTAVQF